MSVIAVCKASLPAGAQCLAKLSGWTVLSLALTLAAGQAQNFTTLKCFGVSSNLTSFYPDSTLIQGPDGTLYGATFYGNDTIPCTVYKLQPDGSGFSVLKFFTNSMDGRYPFGRLTLSDNVLYGTTYIGGDFYQGTVFKVNTDGTGFAVLKSFGDDAANPMAGLALSEGVLYGTTANSPGGAGAVFRMNIDGTGYTLLKSFAGSDGSDPEGDLVLSDGVLFGTTRAGGSNDRGTVFKINLDGTGFAVLKNFIQSEGSALQAGLTLSDGVLCGTASYGGGASAGTIFRLNTDGSGFTVLRNIAYPDGYLLYSSLALSGGVLYGTTYQGGISNLGTVFRLNTDGTGFTTLKAFTGSDGANPFASVMVSGNVLYGTTEQGGSLGRGTVFKLDLSAPLLRIQMLPDTVVLTWDNPHFTLQAAPTSAGAYTNVIGATSPYSNAVDNGQMFFRLIGN